MNFFSSLNSVLTDMTDICNQSCINNFRPYCNQS